MKNWVSIENIELLPEILSAVLVEGVYLPGDRIPADRWKILVDQVHDSRKMAYLAFPPVMRREAELYYERHLEELRMAGFDGYLVRSLDEAGFLAEWKLPGTRVFDQGMYTWNRRAVEQMKQLGADLLTLPVECRREELALRGFDDSEMIVYGRLPVMISAHCSRRTEGKCRVEKGMRREEAAQIVEFRKLEDRKRAGFPEDSHCRFCYNVIYNSVPLWLVDQVPKGISRVRYSFTDETPEQARKILTGGMDPHGDYTRGHWKRGVE